MKLLSRSLTLILLGAALFGLASAPPLQAARGDLNLQAQLVWATDGAKPTDPDLKDIDDATKEKLKGVFKWKNYFEVNRQNFTVPLSSKKRIRMSPKCDVEVENLGDSSLEVKLFGEGKLVVTKRQAIRAGELLVLAGADKNDTAWFVVLTLPKR
jgi:hypothetical protein